MIENHAVDIPVCKKLFVWHVALLYRDKQVFLLHLPREDHKKLFNVTFNALRRYGIEPELKILQDRLLKCRLRLLLKQDLLRPGPDFTQFLLEKLFGDRFAYIILQSSARKLVSLVAEATFQMPRSFCYGLNGCQIRVREVFFLLKNLKS